MNVLKIVHNNIDLLTHTYMIPIHNIFLRTIINSNPYQVFGSNSYTGFILVEVYD
jgi:hypothetical protein